MGSPESLQAVMNTQIYNRNTRISDSEDRSQENSSRGSIGLYNQKIASKKNSDMGGSLNLLVDAIQLLECREIPRTTGLQIQKNVSIQVLPQKLRRIKIALGKPSLQNPQCLVEDHGLESANKLAFSKVSQSVDGEHSFNNISKVGEIEQGTMPGPRSKRGRLQAFPSKYSDSELQPWKKVSRKVPTCGNVLQYQRYGESSIL